MLGVWIAPVTAQLMMTLPAMVSSPGSHAGGNVHLRRATGQGHARLGAVTRLAMPAVMVCVVGWPDHGEQPGRVACRGTRRRHGVLTGSCQPPPNERVAPQTDTRLAFGYSPDRCNPGWLFRPPIRRITIRWITPVNTSAQLPSPPVCVRFFPESLTLTAALTPEPDARRNGEHITATAHVTVDEDERRRRTRCSKQHRQRSGGNAGGDMIGRRCLPHSVGACTFITQLFVLTSSAPQLLSTPQLWPRHQRGSAARDRIITTSPRTFFGSSLCVSFEFRCERECKRDHCQPIRQSQRHTAEHGLAGDLFTLVCCSRYSATEIFDWTLWHIRRTRYSSRSAAICDPAATYGTLGS